MQILFFSIVTQKMLFLLAMQFGKNDDVQCPGIVKRITEWISTENDKIEFMMIQT